MGTAGVRRAAAALITVIACVDVIAGVSLLVHPSRVELGSPSAAQPSAGTPPAAPAPSPTPTPTPSSGAPALPHARPDTLWIPSQHVRAPIEPCRIVHSELEPPQNVQHTCYWAGGAALSAKTGSSVVTGHINWVGQGVGALGNIDKLRRGDLVRTTGKRGVVTTWAVRTVVHRPKSQGIDTTAFVGDSGPRRLYLITCGGPFDTADANYLDNIYVRAVPLRGRPAATGSGTTGSGATGSQPAGR